MKRLLLLAVLLPVLLLAAAQADAGVRPRYGGTVDAALPQAGPALHPASAATVAERFVASLIHQPPLTRDSAGELLPVLLAALPHSPDGGRTFHLQLRPGLRFHDGRQVRAQDLAASLQALQSGPWAALALPVAGLEVRSELHLVVRLAHPYPAWPQALAEVGAAVVPAGAGGELPTGAGPFRIAERSARRLRLQAFTGHAAGRPFLDGITLLPRPDRRGAIRLVTSGQAQIGPARGERAAHATWIFVAPSLQQALEGVVAQAIDREAIVRYFVAGAAQPLERLLPTDEAPAPRPPAADAGVREELTLLYDGGVEGHRQVAERIQLRLHDAGVAVRLEEVEGERLLARSRAGAYELALVQLPLPAEPGLAAATLLHGAGRGDAAARLLRQVGAGAQVAGLLGETRGIVPLYAGMEALLPTAESGLHGEDPAEGWLLPATEE